MREDSIIRMVKNDMTVELATKILDVLCRDAYITIRWCYVAGRMIVDQVNLIIVFTDCFNGGFCCPKHSYRHVSNA